jgi:hypothetical protein
MTPLIRSLATFALMVLVGCTPPPAPVASTPPPPPPVPAPEPPPPPPKPEPDPYELAVQEIEKIVERYSAVYAGVKDEATGDKALAEIDRMTKRLHQLSAEIAKMPYRPGQEKDTLALHAVLTRFPTVALNNEDMVRVLADPELQLKFIAAHQSFVLEVAGLGPAILSRQQAPQQQTDLSHGQAQSPAAKTGKTAP